MHRAEKALLNAQCERRKYKKVGRSLSALLRCESERDRKFLLYKCGPVGSSSPSGVLWFARAASSEREFSFYARKLFRVKRKISVY